MSEKMTIVIICVVKALAVCAAVAYACYLTASGWPLFGLVCAGTSVKYRSDDDENQDDKEKTDE